MPRQVTWNPKSLFKKCLEVIALRVKDYDPNVQVTSSNLIEVKESVSKSDVNPFDNLPTYLLEQIIDVLESKGWLRIINHRDLFVTTHTKELNLSYYCLKYEYVTNVSLKLAAVFLELASIRCQKLISLHMNSVKLSAEDFCKFLPHFQDLQELDVSCSAFNNCCLRTVGKYCRKKLNLIACHYVTDDGIEALCGGESELGKEMLLGKSGQCKSIEELLIRNTQVTQKGLQMALRHLPHLKKLDDWHVVQALAAMYSQKTNSIFPSEYSLTDLDVFSDYSPFTSSFVPYKNGDLRLAAFLCPFVSSVHIECSAGLNDSDILGLIGLEHLNKLTIAASSPANGRSITFYGGLVPFLKVAGSSLKNLALLRFRFFDQSVRLACLVEHCPNLEHLSLYECEYSLSTGVESEVTASRASLRMKPGFAWNHLKKLRLSGTVRCGGFVVEIPTESLFLALSSSPALEELTISYCSTFDDDLVHRVFECHSFASLKWLRLYYCRAITMRGIRLFRNIGMDWNHLSIYGGCDSVKTADGWRRDEENIDI